MYQFSIPMPYSKSEVDRACTINNQTKKSKITGMYFALPRSDVDFTGFEQARTALRFKTNFENWREILTYTKEKGFDFIYLLNSPRAMEVYNNDLNEKLKKLDILINKLYGMGLKKFRISSLRLLMYLHTNYPELELYASTSFEYTSMKQYGNFIEMFPYIKQIVLAHDVNKNFKLLKSLRKAYPDMEFEIMLNEACMGGCPMRIFHSLSCSQNSLDVEPPEGLKLDYHFYADLCWKPFKEDTYLFLCKAHNIYPWEIEEYGKIGYTNFKLVGRESRLTYFENCLTYLKGIDDYKSIENESLNKFIHHGNATPMPAVKDIRPLLPKIEHFKKYGHLCASICGEECRYCYKCAEKINKKFKNSTGV